MKRLTATTVLCLLLFSAAFVTGKGPSAAPEYPDSLRSVWLYTEGVKQNAIAGDSVRARELFLEAIRNDSTYAPAYYELAANGMYATPDEAVELARKAFRLDTTNKWYHQFYGQALIYAGRYDEALKVYRRLQTENPKDPDNYRILAALYEQKQSPVMALVTLDSAELRFGRIPVLSAMKRRLLVATNQIDKAVVEARAMVEAAESNPAIAIQYKMVDQWKEIAGEQVKAFEHINLGNITVFDGGNGATGNFLNQLVKTVAPSLGVLDKLPIGETVKNIIKPDEKDKDAPAPTL